MVMAHTCVQIQHEISECSFGFPLRIQFTAGGLIPTINYCIRLSIDEMGTKLCVSDEIVRGSDSLIYNKVRKCNIARFWGHHESIIPYIIHSKAIRSRR